MNYYNEFDPKAAAWLRELIKAGHIPNGVVDERSITEIQPHELAQYTQCHFFAGIGGWSYALQLAGWPADRPVWTGSCPCQPFSSAGKQEGQDDPRHLWPAFFGLIRECRPHHVFGEQVESAIGHGWLDGVQADLENEGYAVGHCVLGAHSAGAPHIRQRLYWMADANGEQALTPDTEGLRAESGGRGDASSMANPASQGPLSGPHTGVHRSEEGTGSWNGELERCGAASRLVLPISPRLEGHPGHGDHRDQPGRIGAEPDGPVATAGGAWDDYDLLPCTDGKQRRIESGTFPLAHWVPGRVGLLRGYGNAIVPQVAAAFIEEYLALTTPPHL